MNKIRNKRPNAVYVLDLLLMGFPIKFPSDPNYTYRYQDGIFGVEMTRYKTGDWKNKEGEQVVLGVDITLPQFIKMCDSFSYEELFIKSCEVVLTNFNQNKLRKESSSEQNRKEG